MPAPATSSNSPPTEQAQEDQYVEAYHHLPQINEQGFRQHRYWSWGYRYLGRLQLVFDLLEKIEFASLLDVGCGDGRFLQELDSSFADKLLCGIDTSERAITLAKTLNPGTDYQCLDIRALPVDSPWDVVTLLEVLEHVPPGELPEFLGEVAARVKPGGVLLVTVPHLNERRPEKHYQHFEESGIRALLAEEFDVDRVVHFDNIDLRTRLFLKLMGGSGRHFVITNQKLNNLFFRHYVRHCLYAGRQERCKKIAVLAHKRQQARG
jgi:2-polyprenyl-3-methyl-5-hydroxy-6-metoxy-1,4-benzoquinol methylase